MLYHFFVTILILVIANVPLLPAPLAGVKSFGRLNMQKVKTIVLNAALYIVLVVP